MIPETFINLETWRPPTPGCTKGVLGAWQVAGGACGALLYSVCTVIAVLYSPVNVVIAVLYSAILAVLYSPVIAALYSAMIASLYSAVSAVMAAH